MENAIIAQNIKRYFKAGDGTTVHALDGVSMEIKKGTLAILKGRSGSGKTTLLNILSALDMPTEGSVQFLDKNLEQMTEKDREMLRRYEMGFVFQSIALIPTMTAYENVEFALRLAKNKRQIRKNLTDMDNDIGDAKNDVINENMHDRVSELLERVGLSKRMDHMPDFPIIASISPVSTVRSSPSSAITFLSSVSYIFTSPSQFIIWFSPF